MASCWSATDGCIYSTGQMVKKPWCCWTSHCIYSSGQNVNKWIWTFKLNFTFYLEGQSPSTPKLIGISTTVLCIYCPNVVVLAWTGDEFSRGQAWGWHTYTHKNQPSIRRHTCISNPREDFGPMVPFDPYPGAHVLHTSKRNFNKLEKKSLLIHMIFFQNRQKP